MLANLIPNFTSVLVGVVLGNNALCYRTYHDVLEDFVKPFTLGFIQIMIGDSIRIINQMFQSLGLQGILDVLLGLDPKYLVTEFLVIRLGGLDASLPQR